MMTETDIETSVYYVHLTWLIAREDYIKYHLCLDLLSFSDTYTNLILLYVMKSTYYGNDESIVTMKPKAASLVWTQHAYILTSLAR
jgi:hypothetical protein